jgi:hypothetical protein
MVEMDDQFIGFGRRAIPTSQLAFLLRIMIGCGTLRQGEPTDDIYWSVCENRLAIATGSAARAKESMHD